VRSSLDNLNAASLPMEARVYMERARDGIARLTQILTRMTEAARLEHSLSDVAREPYALDQVVASCVAGFRVAYPAAHIACTTPDEPVIVDGSPDLAAQMLDKLLANAVEFAAGRAVDVRVASQGGNAVLTVANDGPPLPADMQGRLFESMVSVREGGGSSGPHLGLGLYIVRVIAQFHRGTARADNRADGSGVVVTVTMPL